MKAFLICFLNGKMIEFKSNFFLSLQLANRFYTYRYNLELKLKINRALMKMYYINFFDSHKCI